MTRAIIRKLPYRSAMAQKDVKLLEAASKDVRLEGLFYRAAAEKHGITKSRLKNLRPGLWAGIELDRQGEQFSHMKKRRKLYVVVRFLWILGWVSHEIW